MAPRRLAADEAALWARVMAEVRPLHAVRATAAPSAASPVGKPLPGTARVSVEPAVPRLRSARPEGAAPPPALPRARVARTPSNTLDGTWDRQLSRGLVSPDRSIDLHGHTLASAHAMLDSALDQAVRGEMRVLLLVTGKPPRPTSERPHARGAIRAAVGDWLAGSRFAERIAAVRAAHPRHGGAGALYIVLRKPRVPPKP